MSLILVVDTTALQVYHVSEPVVVVSEDVAKEEVYNPTKNGEVSIEEEEAPVPEVVNEIPDDSPVVAESYSIVEAKSNSKVEAESNSKVEAESNSKVEAESNSKVEVPKKSYASIVSSCFTISHASKYFQICKYCVIGCSTTFLINLVTQFVQKNLTFPLSLLLSTPDSGA